MGNLIQWLTDPMSSGTANGATPEKFHFYVPWAIFCVLGLVLCFYYFREGRTRFFGSHTLHKALLDRFMPHLGWLAAVGSILLLCRLGGAGIFGWRLWRYAWAAWAVGFFGYWAYYMLLKYRAHLAAYQHQRMMERYMPQPNPKRGRKTARA